MSLGFDSHLLRAVPVGLGGHNSTSHTNTDIWKQDGVLDPTRPFVEFI